MIFVLIPSPAISFNFEGHTGQAPLPVGAPPEFGQAPQIKVASRDAGAPFFHESFISVPASSLIKDVKALANGPIQPNNCEAIMFPAIRTLFNLLGLEPTPRDTLLSCDSGPVNASP